MTIRLIITSVAGPSHTLPQFTIPYIVTDHLLPSLSFFSFFLFVSPILLFFSRFLLQLQLQLHFTSTFNFHIKNLFLPQNTDTLVVYLNQQLPFDRLLLDIIQL